MPPSDPPSKTPLDQVPPPPSAPSITREPEHAGRAGNWENYQRPRAFHRAGAFLGLVFLRLLGWACAVICAGYLVKGFFFYKNSHDQRESLWFCLAGLIGLGITRLIGYVQERSLRCSLCHGTPLHDKGCRKHRTAAKLPLIGYSGAIVISTLFTGKFRCSYCGTPFRLRK